jgi:hypothetical protein
MYSFLILLQELKIMHYTETISLCLFVCLFVCLFICNLTSAAKPFERFDVLLNTIKYIYRNTKVRIKCNDGISEPIYINKGIRQGCGLSRILFNMYIDKIIQEFKTVIKKGIQLSNRKLVNTTLYIYDEILMATSEY